MAKAKLEVKHLTKVVTHSIPVDLLDFVEVKAKELGRSKSYVVTEAIKLLKQLEK